MLETSVTDIKHEGIIQKLHLNLEIKKKRFFSYAWRSFMAN